MTVSAEVRQVGVDEVVVVLSVAVFLILPTMAILIFSGGGRCRGRYHWSDSFDWHGRWSSGVDSGISFHCSVEVFVDPVLAFTFMVLLVVVPFLPHSRQQSTLHLLMVVVCCMGSVFRSSSSLAEIAVSVVIVVRFVFIVVLHGRSCEHRRVSRHFLCCSALGVFQPGSVMVENRGGHHGCTG